MEIFGHNAQQYTWLKHTISAETPYIYISTVKHNGGKVVVCAGFAAPGSVQLALIDSTLNSYICQGFVQSNVS